MESNTFRFSDCKQADECGVATLVIPTTDVVQNPPTDTRRLLTEGTITDN